jgi:hypothetical protein
MKEPDAYRGVNCRFGMKGVIAAPHFDSRRNYIAMIRGRKRYVLLPPKECEKLRLYPRGHPSQRHSQILWSNLTEVMQHPDLFDAPATEVVLSMGEMLYIPSFWFHYIISQDASIQCNARSGESKEGKREIAKCGFVSYNGLGNDGKDGPEKRHQPFLEVQGEEEEGIDGGKVEEDGDGENASKKHKKQFLRRKRPVKERARNKEY